MHLYKKALPIFFLVTALQSKDQAGLAILDSFEKQHKAIMQCMREAFGSSFDAGETDQAPKAPTSLQFPDVMSALKVDQDSENVFISLSAKDLNPAAIESYYESNMAIVKFPYNENSVTLKITPSMLHIRAMQEQKKETEKKDEGNVVMTSYYDQQFSRSLPALVDIKNISIKHKKDGVLLITLSKQEVVRKIPVIKE